MSGTLAREEIRKAIRRENPSRVPRIRTKWWGEGLSEQYGVQLQRFDRYEEDVEQVYIDYFIHPADMGLSWEMDENTAYDNHAAVDDWSKIDEFISKLKAPEDDPKLIDVIAKLKEAREQGRYNILSWWNLFFEHDWVIRGMENFMIDMYIEPDNVHKLQQALCDHFIRTIRYVDDRVKLDGFFASDDLGHQTGPMFSPELFETFFLPYYSALGSFLKERDIDFWLHTCGDVTVLIPYFIKAGVTVLHPIQKHTMDEKAVAEEFGDRISFFAGIDVQHILQEETPERVREEVRFLIDTFDRPEGGMCIAAGNGIVSGTPIENIEAFLDEAESYGKAHREMVRSKERWERTDPPVV